MEWSLNWAFWRRDGATESVRRGSRLKRGEPKHVEEWVARLVEEGVPEEWAPRLANRLERLHRDVGRGSATAIIRGVAVAVEVQAEAHADIERNVRDVKEVERLLGAFTGELEKLDEVLEVLSAYAQRMRSKPIRKPGHTLH